MLSKIKILFQDIKIQHTVFALPFAIMSAFLAAKGMPDHDKLLWIVLALFGARNSAMAFNRIVDAKLDAKNPRTENRALPAGKISFTGYVAFLIVSVIIFLIACFKLNPLALKLSPLALAIVFFYSLTKRFTFLSHAFLGLALSVAPIGAWVAIEEEISLISLIIGSSVIFWLTGFDIIYSCMDAEADKKNGLFSVPEQFGVSKALLLSRLSHVGMIFFLMALPLFAEELGTVYFSGVAVVTVLLIYEHSLVNENDLSKANIAFFNVNAIISLLLMSVVIIECTIK